MYDSKICFACQKEIIDKVKWQTTHWDKIFAKYITDKGIIICTFISLIFFKIN